MYKNHSYYLYSVLCITFEMFTLASFVGCANNSTAAVEAPKAILTEPLATPSEAAKPTPYSENEIQEVQIEDYIVQKVAGSETKHRYIIRVTTKDIRAPLPMTKAVIQKCWLYQNSILSGCLADDFIDKISKGGTSSWDYSYVIFSLVKVDSESGKATVRIDEVSGPRTSKGMLYTLIKVNGNWQTESYKLLWSS